jgi:DNA polymerase-3 subunit epsilon|tara:strand:- start:295 stop:1071 length:777 start_codon:yes stop_codon:yes gene_type:complete
MKKTNPNLSDTTSLLITLAIAVSLIIFTENLILIVIGWLMVLGFIGNYWETRKLLKELKPIPEAMISRTKSGLSKLKLTEAHVFVDTETTGLSDDDEIIEIAVISEDGEVLLDTFVKHTSRVEISKGARNIHGIKKRRLKNAPSWDEIYPKFMDAVKGKNILTYNSDFDERLINQTCLAWNLPKPLNKYFCVMKLYAAHVGQFKDNGKNKEYKWWKLLDAMLVYPECAYGDKPHRALVDCEQTRRLTKQLIELANNPT